MESIAAFSLAASILQVVQFSLSLFSHSKKLYKAGRNDHRDTATVENIVNDLVKRVESMRVCAALNGQDSDANLRQLYESCLSTSEDLLVSLRKLQLNTKGKIWASFRQALLTLRSQEQVDGLMQRMESIRQEVHFYVAVSARDELFRHTQMLKDLDVKVQSIYEQTKRRPKDLGYPWETGAPDGQLRVDDGFGAEYLLPIELCETPKAFFRILKLRYESQKLPGLRQVQRGHILLWEWNERHLVTKDKWATVIKVDRALKMSFVMGTWKGLPRNRCMRCYKPRTNEISGSSFKSCGSCKLALQTVEPDYLPFEPADTTIWDRNTYRDHQLASRRPRKKDQIKHPDQSAPTATSGLQNSDNTSIELVCHRLTMNWEPIFNLVFRYLLCRCVIRLSTPSRLVEEQTVLRGYVCPRHNTEGVKFRDYSEIALPYSEDPYFDQFGGYDAFWAMIHYHFPVIYHDIGGPQCITDKQLCHGYVDFLQRKEDDEPAVQRVVKDYWFEVADYMVNIGAELPSKEAAEFAQERARREEEVTEKMGFPIDITEETAERFRKSHMSKEVVEIASGKWNGTPHWRVED